MLGWWQRRQKDSDRASDADPPGGSAFCKRKKSICPFPKIVAEIRFEGRMSAHQRNPRFRLAPNRRRLLPACGRAS